MVKNITVEGVTYKVTDEEKYSAQEELIFEIRERGKTSYVIGMWDDLLGAPVKKIWSIVGKSIES